jgi:hypothetical protein
MESAPVIKMSRDACLGAVASLAENVGKERRGRHQNKPGKQMTMMNAMKTLFQNTWSF